MMRTMFIVILLIPVMPGTAPGNEPYEQYQVVVERNMFLRERVRRPEPPPEPQPVQNDVPAVQPMHPVQWHVLRGVAFEDDGPLAFIEDTREGMTRAYRPSDSVAGGIISSITIFAVEFESDERRALVQLGENLSGERAVVARSNNGTGSTGATRTQEAGGSGNDLLERMRQRSRQERGQ